MVIVNQAEIEFKRDMQHTVPDKPTLAEEVAELRKAVEELVYWVRPKTGNLVTGKSAVEEYETLIGGNK